VCERKCTCGGCGGRRKRWWWCAVAVEVTRGGSGGVEWPHCPCRSSGDGSTEHC
jgi:hypothetical protein